MPKGQKEKKRGRGGGGGRKDRRKNPKIERDEEVGRDKGAYVWA